MSATETVPNLPSVALDTTSIVSGTSKPATDGLPVCAHCGSSTNNIARRSKGIKKIEAQYKIAIRRPICGNCLGVLCHKGPDREPSSDELVAESLRSLHVALAGLPKRTDLDALIGIDQQIKTFGGYVRFAEAEFNHAANRAAALAARVSTLTTAWNNAKALVEHRIGRKYETLRKVASETIKNPALRQKIFMRDGMKCLACGSMDFLSIDHVISVRSGGSNDESNLQTLCISCNCSKQDEDAEDWKQRGLERAKINASAMAVRRFQRRAVKEEKKKARAVDKAYQISYADQ